MKFNFYPTIIFSTLFLICVDLSAQAPKWLWAKPTGGLLNDNLFYSAIDPNGSGDIYTTGYFEGTLDFDPGEDTFNLTSNGGFDIFIYKLDASGNLVWARSFGGTDIDYGISIVPDASGNVYFTGAFVGTVDFDAFQLTSSGLFDLLIARLDVDGNLVWAKSLGGDAINFAQHMAVDPSGNGDVYLTGRFNGTTDFEPDSTKVIIRTAADWDIFTVKFNVDGNMQWVTTQGSSAFDVGYGIAVDPTGSGDVYSTGSFRGTVDFDPDSSEIFNLTCPGNQCLYLTKLDADGNFIWAKTITSPNNIYGRALAIDPDNGDIYTTGVFNGTVDFDPGKEMFNITPDGYDSFISKLDRDGNFVWAKSMGGASFDIGSSIAVDPEESGDIYLLGFFGGTVDFDPGPGVTNLTSQGGDDIFLTKLDKAGNLLWAKSIGGTGREYGATILADLNGQVYVTGQFNSESISLDSTTLTNADNSGTTFDFFIAKMEGSLPSAVNNETYENVIFVYPNPMINELTIDIDKSELFNAGINLYNPSGTVCYSLENQHIPGKKTMNVSSLPAGIYFVELDIDGKKFISRVVKE